MQITHKRLAQLIATRNKLNNAGADYYLTDASDTVPGNSSEWNNKRIRIRNKLNTRIIKSMPGRILLEDRTMNNIVSLCGDRLYAVARFEYRGYLVSASTLARKDYYEVAVCNVKGEEVYKCDTVEAAINYINCTTEFGA